MTHGSKARIAVIGAGLMGHGIAQVFALAGHDVTITDPHTATLDAREGSASPPTCAISATTRRAVERVRPVADLADCVRDADFVVEAVLEDLPLKQKMFAEIEKHVRAGHDPRQQHLGDADHADHGRAAASRARARHALVEPAVSWCRWSR